MACTHISSADISPPTASQSVYREDCTLCFDSIDSEAGLNVCLHCFNGGCAGDRDHASLHSRRLGHPLALNIKRTRKQVERDEPPVKMSKLAIEASSEDDQYDVATKVVCLDCRVDKVDECPPKVLEVVDKLMKAPTFSRKEEVKAWEQELTPCEHTLGLQQGSNQGIRIREPSKCYGCDLNENLWLCLECGTVGCGRAQFGGVGGNSHALAHSTEKSHGVAVKLRSITPEGSADIYCYTCNEERTDPELAQHLAHWGINIAEQEKTEKSLTELQIEQNLKWDFSMTSNDGKVLNPVFGPELTGLKNLGNSCYMASVLQCLFALPEFRERYYKPKEEPPASSVPAEDLETQLRKIADGLLSGRYSIPDPTAGGKSDVVYQHGISPSMFKHLIGKGHPEFSTMRQQDAFELMLHLFKMIGVSTHSPTAPDPVESFRFAVEQRLQCTSCRKVRYKVDTQDNISVEVPAIRLNHFMPGPGTDQMWETVPIEDCLETFTRTEEVDLNCSGCGNKTFTKQTLFKTLPENLVVNARRWEVVNYVPMKLDIPVEVGNKPLDLTQYLSEGKKDDEELLEDEVETEPEFAPNPEASAALAGMGFPEVRVKKALFFTGNSDQEAALNWILAHMEDPDIDEPLPPTRSGAGTGSSQKPSDGDNKIDQLADMGIPRDRAEKALGMTDWDVTRALDWVFSHPDEPTAPAPEATTTSSAPATAVPGSGRKPAAYDLQSIVCHKGTSVHAGHYVAFARKHIPGEPEPKWILFNDEKVVAEAGDVNEMKQFAYIYIFRRM